MSDHKHIEVTPEKLAALHRQKEELRGQLDQAKGRLAALERQRETHLEELKKLGVTPEEAPEQIEKLKAEISELYIKATSIVEEIKNATRSQN